jgi:hypothetical protein
VELINLNPETQQIFQIERELIAIAARFDLRLHTTPAAIRAEIAKLSSEKTLAIVANMRNFRDNLLTCETEGIDPWNDGEFFQLSMRSLGLTYPRDFVDTIEPDDLIEGYDMARFQIFRNMAFMEKTDYSLAEILSFEWPFLFDRAAAITERMISYCDQILWSKNQTIPFEIPAHFLRELRTNNRHAYEITFRYLSPLFTGPNQPFGILGTCKAEQQLALDKEDNLAFI